MARKFTHTPPPPYPNRPKKNAPLIATHPNLNSLREVSVEDVSAEQRDASDAPPSSWAYEWFGVSRADLVREVRMLLVGVGWLILFLGLAPFADSLCGEGRCAVLDAPLSQWLRLAGFARLLSPPTELVDRAAFFSLRRVASAALSSDSPILSTATFYFVAFEGSLGRLLWLSALTGFNNFQQHFSLATVEDTSLGRVLQAVVVYQLLCVLRNFFVRW